MLNYPAWLLEYLHRKLHGKYVAPFFNLATDCDNCPRDLCSSRKSIVPMLENTLAMSRTRLAMIQLLTNWSFTVSDILGPQMGFDGIRERMIDIRRRFVAPPHSPQVTLTATTTNSLTMKLRPHPADNAPIHGYTIHYKPEFGDWETAQISSTAQKYTLENLWCGSRYQIYVTAYNG